MTLRPRVHNVLSYSLTLVTFWGVLLVRSSHQPLSGTATFGAALWTAHFVRRTLESAFVHRYSKPTVGVADVASEYVYYWGFAAWIAWSLGRGEVAAPAPGLQALGLVLFLVAELGNARAHRMLRDLRGPEAHEKPIPRGFLFERVSCPHYFFEIVSWLGFELVTGTLAGLLFLLVGAGILGTWAHTRHRAYRQRFDGREGRELYPRARRALVPFVF